MAKLLPLTLAIACNAELILDGGDNGWSQADDATAGDRGGSKKKQKKGSEWPVVVGVILALAFLMILGIGCSLWARGARVDPSDSKATAVAPGEETEEPLQVV